MCFFCKKKSRNEMERQYDAGAAAINFLRLEIQNRQLYHCGTGSLLAII